MKVNFLHISDVHYSTSYDKGHPDFLRMMKKMPFPLQQLQKLFDGNNEKFDFVVVTGDICEYGTKQEYNYVLNWLKKYFDCPIIATCGNHDNKQEFIQGFLGVDKLDPLFEEHICKGLRVICFDTSDPIEHDGIVSEATCDLLEKKLADKQLPTILITHHHLDPDQFCTPTAKYSDRFRKIIANSSIIGILNGHTHHLTEGKFEGKNYYTSGSLSFVGESEGAGTMVYFYAHPSAESFVFEDGVLTKKIYEDKDEPKLLDQFIVQKPIERENV